MITYDHRRGFRRDLSAAGVASARQCFAHSFRAFERRQWHIVGTGVGGASPS